MPAIRPEPEPQPSPQSTTANAKAPLEPSSSRVAAASVLWPVRKTLVAPMLPEPMERRSPSPAKRVNPSPKGTDPIRYPTATAIRKNCHRLSMVQEPSPGFRRPVRKPGARR